MAVSSLPGESCFKNKFLKKTRNTLGVLGKIAKSEGVRLC